MSVTCDYCKRPAKFHSDSKHIYGGRDFGAVWDCRPCDAYVGCHPDGSPKGTLAKAERRDLRKAAHYAFDPLWLDWRGAYPDAQRSTAKIRHVMRVRAYEWLAHHMQLPFEQTHIAMFDEAKCVQVIKLIREHKATAKSVRAWAKRRRAAA